MCFRGRSTTSVPPVVPTTHRLVFPHTYCKSNHVTIHPIYDSIWLKYWVHKLSPQYSWKTFTFILLPKKSNILPVFMNLNIHFVYLPTNMRRWWRGKTQMTWRRNIERNQTERETLLIWVTPDRVISNFYSISEYYSHSVPSVFQELQYKHQDHWFQSSL